VYSYAGRPVIFLVHCAGRIRPDEKLHEGEMREMREMRGIYRRTLGNVLSAINWPIKSHVFSFLSLSLSLSYGIMYLTRSALIFSNNSRFLYFLCVHCRAIAGRSGDFLKSTTAHGPERDRSRVGVINVSDDAYVHRESDM